MTDIQDRAIESIVNQWNGGEHILAGKRASELVFGSSGKANEKLLQKITEEATGIERYIVAPSGPPVTQVGDQGGDPQAVQPENRPEATGASNVSSEKAKDEQDQIDQALAAGRQQREGSEQSDGTGSTKLNPTGSDKAPKGKGTKPSEAKTASK